MGIFKNKVEESWGEITRHDPSKAPGEQIKKPNWLFDLRHLNYPNCIVQVHSADCRLVSHQTLLHCALCSKIEQPTETNEAVLISQQVKLIV